MGAAEDLSEHTDLAGRGAMAILKPGTKEVMIPRLGLAQSANGNGDTRRRRCIRRRQHVAAAVEDAARVNHQARRVNFTGYDAFGLDFDAAFGEDDAVIAPRDHHAIALDLAFDLGVFAQDDCLF